MDKIDPDGKDYKTLEQDFKEGLGLQNNRFLLCTSYCDDYDTFKGKSRLKQRHPELDIPILDFMRQVSVYKFISIQIIGDFKTAKHSEKQDLVMNRKGMKG